MRDTTNNNTKKHNTKKHNTKKHNTKKHNTKKHNTKKHNPKKHNTKKHNAKKHNTKKHNAKKHNTKKHNTKKHNAKKHNTNRHASPLVNAPPNIVQPWPACQPDHLQQVCHWVIVAALPSAVVKLRAHDDHQVGCHTHAPAHGRGCHHNLWGWVVGWWFSNLVLVCMVVGLCRAQVALVIDLASCIQKPTWTTCACASNMVNKQHGQRPTWSTTNMVNKHR